MPDCSFTSPAGLNEQFTNWLKCAIRGATSVPLRLTGEPCCLAAWRGNRISVISLVEGEHAGRLSGLLVQYSAKTMRESAHGYLWRKRMPILKRGRSTDATYRRSRPTPWEVRSN